MRFSEVANTHECLNGQSITLESFLVQHYILSSQIVLQILYDYRNWYTLLEAEMGHHISIAFCATKFYVEKTHVW